MVTERLQPAFQEILAAKAASDELFALPEEREEAKGRPSAASFTLVDAHVILTGPRFRQCAGEGVRRCYCSGFPSERPLHSPPRFPARSEGCQRRRHADRR